MSYDLIFTGTLPSREAFQQYFDARDCYELKDGQAWYENSDTGVYFSFEFDDSPDNEIGDTGASSVMFNMNFFRPHIFGLEAVGEVERFVRQFELSVEDPQLDGIDSRVFSREGFLTGWNAGNEFACRAFLNAEEPIEPFIASTQTLEETWRWNYGRSALQDELFAFVPSFMFFQEDEENVGTLIVWGDGIPMVIPQADWVVLVRDDLKLDPSSEESEFVTLPFSALNRILEGFRREIHAGVPVWVLDYEEPPPHVVDFFQSQSAVELERGRLISVDSVLNRELIDQARR